MESYEALIGTLALTMGASWASGINLYAALLVLGLAGSSGNLDLPPDLEVLQDPMVIGAAGLMYFVEFFVDKTPGVDTGWDTIHTFIRIPAGALLAAGAVGDVTPALEIASGIMGGTLAATSHTTKAGTRAIINTSPEPFSNWGASITEDLMVFGGLWAALNHPVIFLCILLAFILIAIWLLPKIWAALKAIANTISGWFGKVESSLQSLPEESPVQASNGNPETDIGHNDTASFVDELARLEQLKHNGSLTDEEFEAAKRKLLI
ncbi:MAG: hypothetical protein AseanaTS_05930 [Candidatus Pelagadaptatus aseana]|uniref:DUF4126 family protein n=1 Tax=Candidatus Pelagadaptatus aseana TaxID=3120508 RepID=UPI0039B30D51